MRSGLWFAVAFVAAMLAFAPQTASAREAHHCAPGLQASHTSHAATPSAGQATAPHVIVDIALQPLQFFDPPASVGDLADCDGSCCLGMGCCPAAITNAAQDVPPPPRDGLTTTTPRLGRPSAERASLLEPPNAAA